MNQMQHFIKISFADEIVLGDIHKVRNAKKSVFLRFLLPCTNSYKLENFFLSLPIENNYKLPKVLFEIKNVTSHFRAAKVNYGLPLVVDRTGLLTPSSADVVRTLWIVP